MNRLSSRTDQTKKPDGFTLIELLTGIAIIGILAALLIPVVGRVRESAHSSKCVANIRAIVLGCQIYALDTGHYPPTQDTRGGRHINWIHHLANSSITEGTIGWRNEIETLWFCPSAVRARKPADSNANSYAQNWQTGGWYMDPNRPEGGTASTPELVPEPSRTAMIMDGPWNGSTFSVHIGRDGQSRPDFIHPPSAVTPQGSFGSINVGFVDGHVRAMTNAEVPTNLNDIFWRGSPSTSQSGGFF